MYVCIQENYVYIYVYLYENVNKKVIKKKKYKLDSVTLSQLAFLRGSDPNFSWKLVPIK